MPPRNRFNLTRRNFVKTAVTATAAPLLLPKSVFGANEKLNLAWVGFGGMGWGDLRSCAGDNNVVALCDCDKNVWKKGKPHFPNAKYYSDFRKMLAEMGDSIDAVGVGTPDHTHFHVAYMAMKRGKHVFVEKPLAHSVRELRTLRELASSKNVVTQMGNQGHASEGARLVKEWYDAGLIGEVREVIAWTDRPAAGWGFNGRVESQYPPAQAVPGNLDWNLWLGPVAGDIAYNPAFHPSTWRPWWAFGCGGLGDIGCHTIDTAYWALDLGAPGRVDVEMKEAANLIYTPNGSVVTYTFPARGKKPPVSVKWYEGPSLPEKPEGFDGHIDRSGGLIVIGTDGGIWHRGMRPDSPQLYPAAKWQEYRANPEKRVPKTLPRTRGIHHDWINAIRTGGKSCSDFSYSAPLTEAIVLGTLAIRTGKGFEWDAEHCRVKGNADADAMIDIPAREGWRAEDLG